MNSTRRKNKSTDYFGNSSKDSKCFVWYGSPNVTLGPLVERNLSPNIFYSLNKKNRWDIEAELLNSINPIKQWTNLPQSFYDPWAENLDTACNVGRVAHKRHHNVIEIEPIDAVCTDESDHEPLPLRKWFPKQRRQHRNHHRPAATLPPYADDDFEDHAKESAFIVFPRSDKIKDETVGHRHKVTATKRTARGRKQGKRAKNAWQSAQLIRDVRNDLDMDTELHTDDEYDQAFRVFLHEVEGDTPMVWEDAESGWCTDELSGLQNYPEIEDCEATATATNSLCNSCSSASILPTSRSAFKKYDILTHFENLLTHNKSTVEYLQSAVERAQSLAIWKYLEFITTPLVSEIPRFLHNAPELKTYSFPALTTDTTSWCTPASTPWTMICNPTEMWSDHQQDWCFLNRESEVDQWRAQWPCVSYPFGRINLKMSSNYPQLLTKEIYRTIEVPQQCNTPKQLFCSSVWEPTEKSVTRTEWKRASRNDSSWEIDVAFESIRLPFAMNEKKNRTVPQIRTSAPAEQPRKKKLNWESDVGLESIRLLFAAADKKNGTVPKRSSRSKKLKSNGNKKNNDHENCCRNWDWLFIENSPDDQVSAKRSSLSKSIKTKQTKKKTRKHRKYFITSLRTLFAEDSECHMQHNVSAPITNDPGKAASKVNFTSDRILTETIENSTDAEHSDKFDQDWISEPKLSGCSEEPAELCSDAYIEDKCAQEGETEEEDGLFDDWVIVDADSQEQCFM